MPTGLIRLARDDASGTEVGESPLRGGDTLPEPDLHRVRIRGGGHEILECRGGRRLLRVRVLGYGEQHVIGRYFHAFGIPPERMAHHPFAQLEAQEHTIGGKGIAFGKIGFEGADVARLEPQQAAEQHVREEHVLRRGHEAGVQSFDVGHADTDAQHLVPGTSGRGGEQADTQEQHGGTKEMPQKRESFHRHTVAPCCCEPRGGKPPEASIRIAPGFRRCSGTWGERLRAEGRKRLGAGPFWGQPAVSGRTVEANSETAGYVRIS